MGLAESTFHPADRSRKWLGISARPRASIPCGCDRRRVAAAGPHGREKFGPRSPLAMHRVSLTGVPPRGCSESTFPPADSKRDWWGIFPRPRALIPSGCDHCRVAAAASHGREKWGQLPHWQRTECGTGLHSRQLGIDVPPGGRASQLVRNLRETPAFDSVKVRSMARPGRRSPREGEVQATFPIGNAQSKPDGGPPSRLLGIHLPPGRLKA